MDKTKYISIQLDEVMEKVLSKQRVVIVDRYNQTFNYPDELSVAEWFEMPLRGDNASLVDAMGYANYVRVKFIGKQCNHIKDLTRTQVADLRKAYFLHKIYR